MNLETGLFLSSKDEKMSNCDRWFENVEIHKKFMNMLPEAIIACRDKKIMFANNCAAYFLECDSTEELIGENLCEYIYFEDDEKQKDKICKQFFSDKGEIIKDVKIITSKGKIIDSEIKASSLKELNLKIMILIDKSEFTKLKNKQKESEDRSRRILELLPEGIFVHDGEKLLFVNPEAKRLLKIDKNINLTERPILDYVHPKYKETLYRIKEKMLQPNYIVPLEEEKLVLKDGTVVDIEALGTSIMYDGKKASIVAIRDIGYRKRAEKLKLQIEKKKKMLREAKEHEKLRMEFLANVSHEFKTPLNIILTTQQLLKLVMKSEIDKNQSLDNYLSIIKKNSYRILRLTNNILDITEMDSGCYEVNIINKDIVDTINQIIDPVSRYLANREIDFSFNTDIKEMIIACDPIEIQRVLLNLISNSIKAIDSVGKIEVSLCQTERNIKITVKDTGCGIPEDKIKYIFDALRQVDKSFTRKSEGSGLGLYIAKYIVEKHGGKIRVKSRHNVGSDFQVILPKRRVDKLCENTKIKKVDNYLKSDPNEKVNIEFSDIY